MMQIEHFQNEHLLETMFVTLDHTHLYGRSRGLLVKHRDPFFIQDSLSPHIFFYNWIPWTIINDTKLFNDCTRGTV